MKKFLAYYWLSILLLFALFYWDTSILSLYLNQLQTDLTALWTSWIVPAELMQGHHIIISEDYRLVIEKACNGMIPYLFFLASIIAFPSSYWHKIVWALVGYILLMVVNVLRIGMVTEFVLDGGRQNFSFAHDYIGNSITVATALFLFILFVKTRPSLKHSKLSHQAL